MYLTKEGIDRDTHDQDNNNIVLILTERSIVYQYIFKARVSCTSISYTFKILKMLLTTVLSLIISAYINNKVAAERL